MSEPTNTDRAGWAEQAARFFGVLTEMQGEDLRFITLDLLVNIHHLARREGWPIGKMMKDARTVANQEVKDEEGL